MEKTSVVGGKEINGAKFRLLPQTMAFRARKPYAE